MDLIKCGLFIAGLRKEQSMTQKDLAEKIGVTDKAVSRWETGKGFPDVSILKQLSQVLDVSITEIINGEKTTSERENQSTDNAIVGALAYAKKMRKKLAGTLVLLFGLGIILSILFLTNTFMALRIVLGAAIACIGSITLLRKTPFERMEIMNLTKRTASIISLFALIVTFILELLPYGVVMIFAPGPTERIRRTYSYFSLMPFGYANIFPLITAVLTVVVMALSVVLFAQKSKSAKLQNVVFICTVTACISSVIPFVILGIDYMSIIGVAVSISLLVSVIFQAFSNRISFN